MPGLASSSPCAGSESYVMQPALLAVQEVTRAAAKKVTPPVAATAVLLPPGALQELFDVGAENNFIRVLPAGEGN